MSYSFDDELETASKEYGGSGGGIFYKIQEGNGNVIRILTRGATYATQRMGVGQYRTLYGKEKGDPLRSPEDSDAKKPNRIIAPIDKNGKVSKPSIRTVVYVIDRTDGRIRQAELPYSVVKQVSALQKNPDYMFEDLPMPYDIRITYNKDEAPMSMYRVEVKPNGAAPTEEQLADLASKVEKYSPEAVVQQKKDRQMEEDMKRGLRISSEDIAKEAADFNATMNETARKQRAEAADTEIQYPTEDINPEDIPF